MVKTIELSGVDLHVRLYDREKFLDQAKARLIIRERKSRNRYLPNNRYLYLVYRNGKKIKEHYIAKLTNEKI